MSSSNASLIITLSKIKIHKEVVHIQTFEFLRARNASTIIPKITFKPTIVIVI